MNCKNLLFYIFLLLPRCLLSFYMPSRNGNCKCVNQTSYKPKLFMLFSDDANSTDYYKMRFSGISKLFGIDGLEKLRESHVGVVGLGGVGSWAVESLARSGVGFLTLIDLDSVCTSNTNRQTTALNSTIGKLKAQVLKERVRDINPECNVEVVLDFLTSDTAEKILCKYAEDGNFCSRFDFILDAVDNVNDKCAIIDFCQTYEIPIVTVGAAGGRMDPSKVTYADLTRVENDELLFRVRKTLRNKYSFSRGTKRKPKGKKWGVAAVYSMENVVENAVVESSEIAKTNKFGFTACDGHYGTVSFVTGIFGLTAAGLIVINLAQSHNNLKDNMDDFRWSKYSKKNRTEICNYSTRERICKTNLNSLDTSLANDIHDADITYEQYSTHNNKLQNSFSCCTESKSNFLTLTKVDKEKSFKMQPHCGSNVKYLDAHCHLQMLQNCDTIRNEVVKAKNLGVETIVVCSTSLNDWDTVALIAKEFPNVVIPCYGIHPWWAENYLTTEIDWKVELIQRLERNVYAGIGECGLDKGKKKLISMSDQKEILNEHLRIAGEMGRHITIHCVGAYGNLLDILEKRHPDSLNYSIILHAFNGDTTMIRSFLDQNCYFSLSLCKIIQDEASMDKVLQLATKIPIDRLLLESDCEDDTIKSAVWMIPSVYRIVSNHLRISEDQFRKILIDNSKLAFRNKFT